MKLQIDYTKFFAIGYSPLEKDKNGHIARDANNISVGDF
jgi:hypothetical protein